MTIETVNIDTLKPFVDNPRAHPERNIEAIERSIQRFGWTNPILVRQADRMIIAGHGRVEAARRAGLDTVPVIFLDFSENDAKLYSITDNETHDQSTFDDEKLKELLKALEAMPEIDLSDTGFSQAEIDAILASVDDIPTPDDFSEIGDDIETEYECPKCGYQWSGKPN